uniref:Type II secretion system protein F n=1 Tax=Macrostomum lignano TaxID=282301 RepID=A0A1I8FKK6_9PLAT
AIAGITALMLAWSSSLSHQHVRCTVRLRDNAESDWLLELGRGQDSATRHLRRLTGFCQLRSQLAWPRANSRLPDIVDQLIGLVGSPYRTVSTDASVALVRLCTELGPIISGIPAAGAWALNGSRRTNPNDWRHSSGYGCYQSPVLRARLASSVGFCAAAWLLYSSLIIVTRPRYVLYWLLCLTHIARIWVTINR